MSSSRTSTRASQSRASQSRPAQDKSMKVKPGSPPMQCPQCLDHYKDPRLLDCYHSICCSCLSMYAEANERDGKISCPLCKSEMLVPEGGVWKIQKNYYISSMSERDTVKCDVCGDKTKAEYTCIDCSQNYCSFCLKFHSKLQGTKDHRVASVDENGIRKVRKTASLCKTHPKLELSYFCDTCQELICMDCNMTSHKTHECQSLDLASLTFKERLESVFHGEEHNEIVSNLQEIKKELKQKANMGTDNNHKLLESIEVQAKKFHHLIDEVKSELVRVVVEAGSSNVDAIKEEAADVDRKLASFSALIQFSRLLLAQAEDVDIVKHGAKLAAKIESIKEEASSKDEADSIDIQQFTFDKKDLNKEEVKEMFGALDKPGHEQDVERKGNETVREFTCKNQTGIITAIAPCQDGSSWICFGNEGFIQRYSIKGKCLKTVDVGHSVDDLVLRDEALYLSCNARMKILVYKNDTFTTFTRTKSCARGLAMTNDKEYIVVGLTEKDVFFNCSENPSAGLVKINKDGQQKSVRGRNEIKYPARIAISSKGNMAVSDWIALQVIIVDTEGNQISAFHGVDKNTDFVPRGVCCGADDAVYVIDSETDSVLKLKQDGNLIKTLATVENCWSIAQDCNGHLWVGSQSGKITIMKE